jgi:hypothetical protein
MDFNVRAFRTVQAALAEPAPSDLRRGSSVQGREGRWRCARQIFEQTPEETNSPSGQLSPLEPHSTRD